MKSERNNGYLASTVVTEQSADLPESTSQDSISTPNSLQVTYGSRGGTTTSVLQHPIKPQRPIGVTRVTSITRRRRGTVSRQRLLGVLAITLLATCLFILLLLALNTTRECVREPHPNVCMTEECVQTAASLLAAMDRTVAPCIDFFQYACGTWNRLHVIPEDRSAISTFEILADQLQVILKRVLEEPPNENDNNATLKAKMFYSSHTRDRGRPFEENLGTSWWLAGGGGYILEATDLSTGGSLRSSTRRIQRRRLDGTMGRSR
ncbi:uncharacterized protein [Temnothorax nylanderi]|uniref:uncharacterized protein isoform X3 n=1 Tax=Temnothorax nylanderi TaxID=102681 RepID=UPI003A88F0A7